MRATSVRNDTTASRSSVKVTRWESDFGMPTVYRTCGCMDPRSSSVDMAMGERADDRAVAFAPFYEAELPRQVRAAALILGSVAAAQDAVHDAFVQVYRRWAEIEEPGPYLQQSVVNRCRDVLRHRSVVQRHER